MNLNLHCSAETFSFLMILRHGLYSTPMSFSLMAKNRFMVGTRRRTISAKRDQNGFCAVSREQELFSPDCWQEK